MEEHVVERNLQEVLDAEGAALRGDDGAVKVLLNRLMGFIRHPSKWQWVIHGETALYRGWVVQWLMGQERYKMARRFALCGRGDIALCREDAQAARVKTQGCGARFCPRCSRRFGACRSDAASVAVRGSRAQSRAVRDCLEAGVRRVAKDRDAVWAGDVSCEAEQGGRVALPLPFNH